MQLRNVLRTGLVALCVGALGLAGPMAAMADTTGNAPAITEVSGKKVTSGAVKFTLAEGQTKIWITGTAKAGAKVTAKVDSGKAECTATTDASGRWSCALPVTAFPNVKGKETVTNVTASVTTGGETFTGDKVAVGVRSCDCDDVPTPPDDGGSTQAGAPVITEVAGKPAASGSVKITLVQDQTKIWITGTADPGTAVTARTEDGKATCTATANASGRWSCALPVSAFPNVKGKPTTTNVLATATSGGKTLTSDKVAVGVQSCDCGEVPNPPDPGTLVNPTITSVAGVAVAGNDVYLTKPTATTVALAGTGTPGATVTAALKSDPATKCTATVKADGTWTCTLPTSAFPAGTGKYVGTEVTVKATLGDKSASGANVCVYVTNPSTLAKPVITGVGGISVDGDSVYLTKDEAATVPVTGSGTPGATVTAALKSDPATKCTATVTAAGTWTCSLPASAFPAGKDGKYTPTWLTVKATQGAASATGEEVCVYVTEGTTLAKPTLSTVGGVAVAGESVYLPASAAASYPITGTATPGSSVTVALKSTPATKCTATATAAGTWSCTLPTSAFPAGKDTYLPTWLTLSATKDGKTAVGADVCVWVKDTTPAVTVPEITEIDNVGVVDHKVFFVLDPAKTTVPVSGTAAAGSSVKITTETGETCTGAANAAGAFSCVLPASAFPATDAGYTPTDVTVKATLDARTTAGKTVTANAKLKTDPNAGAPRITSVQGVATGNGEIRLQVAAGGEPLHVIGTGTPGLQVVILKGGNKEVCSTSVAADKSFSCVLPAAEFPGAPEGEFYLLVPSSVNNGRSVNGPSVPMTLTSAKGAVSGPQITGVYTSRDLVPGQIADIPLCDPAYYPNTVYGIGEPGKRVTVFRSRFDPADSRIAEASLPALTCTATVAANGQWSCTPKGDPFLVNASSQLTPQARPVTWINAYTESGGKKYTGREVGIRLGYITPIAIDFSGAGQVETLPADRAPAPFALVEGKDPVKSGWIAPSAGFLVVDKDNDGKITSMGEMFGGLPGEGFGRLAELDANDDGVIDARDPAWATLSIWRDANSDKVTQPGELIPIADTGIVSLTVPSTHILTDYSDGTLVIQRSVATLADGTTAAMEDVLFTVED